MLGKKRFYSSIDSTIDYPPHNYHRLYDSTFLDVMIMNKIKVNSSAHAGIIFQISILGYNYMQNGLRSRDREKTLGGFLAKELSLLHRERMLARNLQKCRQFCDDLIYYVFFPARRFCKKTQSFACKV
jgi:hypothetical protein